MGQERQEVVADEVQVEHVTEQGLQTPFAENWVVRQDWVCGRRESRVSRRSRAGLAIFNINL